MSFGVGESCRRSALEVEGAGQEGCHLSSGYYCVGAVPRRGGGASLGDFQLGHAFHVGRPPDCGVQVGEPRGSRRGGLVGGPDEPHPHHPAQERFVGADPPFAALGAFHDPLAVQGVDGRFVSPAVIVEAVLRRRADGQHQEPGGGRHRYPESLALPTRPVRRSAATARHPRLLNVSHSRNISLPAVTVRAGVFIRRLRAGRASVGLLHGLRRPTGFCPVWR